MTKKKVLSLIGSPREESISAHLQRLFLSGFADFAEIEEVRVYQHAINPCTACGHCKDLLECVFNDGMTFLYHSLEHTDFIAVSSPVYFSSLPGQLKNLIDRCQVFWERKNRGGRRTAPVTGFFIAVAGSDYADMFLPSVTVIRHWFNALGIRHQANDFILLPSAETLTVSTIPLSVIEAVHEAGKRYAHGLRKA